MSCSGRKGICCGVQFTALLSYFWNMLIANRFRALWAAAAAFGALALTSTALAASPPNPDDPTIVPAESIGGVSIGQAGKDAEAAWGDAGNCQANDEDNRQCNYGSVKKGSASLLVYKGTAVSASILAPLKNREFKFTGPLMDFRTAQGDLGLGSKLAKVEKAFPGAKVIEKRQVTVKGEGGVEMVFFSSDKKHITQVVLRDRSPIE